MSDTVLAALVGGVVGSGVTGILGFISIHLQRRADERRQIRELAVKVALENFKIYRELAAATRTVVQPLDSFLIHAMCIVAELDGSLKTEVQILEFLRRAYAHSDAAEKAVEERMESLRARNSGKPR